MNAPLETVLDALRRRLQDRLGDRLDRVILFGSRARGDAEVESDIDVMIVLRSEPSDGELAADICVDIAAELSLEHDTVILPFLTDSRTMADSVFSLYRNVRREGIAI